jgi:hypothetical protein
MLVKDGTAICLYSRNGRRLDPYFPELVKGAHQALPSSCIINGEIVGAKPMTETPPCDGSSYQTLRHSRESLLNAPISHTGRARDPGSKVKRCETEKMMVGDTLGNRGNSVGSHLLRMWSHQAAQGVPPAGLITG